MKGKGVSNKKAPFAVGDVVLILDANHNARFHGLIVSMPVYQPRHATIMAAFPLAHDCSPFAWALDVLAPTTTPIDTRTLQCMLDLATTAYPDLAPPIAQALKNTGKERRARRTRQRRMTPAA